MCEAHPISWQEMLDLFTTEMQSEKFAETWAEFQSLHGEEEMMELVYNLDVFRKRVNAWHSKNARVAPSKSSAASSDSMGQMERPGNVRDVVSLTHGENPNFPAASNALDLRWSKEKGRHVIATKDIELGDTLFLEDPFASVLCDTHATHCEMCCLPLPALPVRCRDCQNASYCSQLCLAEAIQQYHTFECGSSLAEHVGIARLGLRVTLVAESLGCLSSELASRDSLSLALASGCSLQVETRPQQYARVMDLLTHLEDMSNEDRLQYTLTSLLLVVDQARRRKVRTEQRASFTRKFGGRVLRHLAQLVCNGNAITSYLMQDQQSEAGLMQERQARVATAIFPSASMMNHSCDPNILTSYLGRTLIARAARRVVAGEEVFNCYGPHYRSTKSETRRMELQQQYFFLCQCPPCTRTVDFLDAEGIEAALCPECSGPALEKDRVTSCVACRHQLSRDQVRELREHHRMSADALHEADQLAEMGDFAGAAMFVSKGLQHQRAYLHPFNRKIAQSLDYLAMLEARQGHFSKSLAYLEASLPLVERCHGAHSVEVSGVLDTMLDIAGQELINSSGKDWQEHLEKALAWCARAQNIVATLLGPWHARMLSLHATQQHLKTLQQPAT